MAVVSLFNQAFVGEAVFGSSQDKKPILATEGLRSCIAFAGRDASEKIGFLAHFMGPDQVDGFYSQGIKILEGLSKKTELVFDCVLIGGSKKTVFSEKIIDKLKAGFSSYPNITFRIIHEEKPSEKFDLKSLSFDLRDGTYGKYNIEDDPDPRIKTKEDESRVRTNDLFCRLVCRRL